MDEETAIRHPRSGGNAAKEYIRRTIRVWSQRPPTPRWWVSGRATFLEKQSDSAKSARPDRGGCRSNSCSAPVSTTTCSTPLSTSRSLTKSEPSPSATEFLTYTWDIANFSSVIRTEVSNHFAWVETNTSACLTRLGFHPSRSDSNRRSSAREAAHRPRLSHDGPRFFSFVVPLSGGPDVSARKTTYACHSAASRPS